MESLEITVNDKKTDAFKVQEVLKRYKAIHKIYVVDSVTVRIYFNPKKIIAKRVLKIISSLGSERKRNKNVKSIREIPEESKTV